MKKQAQAGKETFGLIIGTRAYFNSELAVDVRKTLIEELDKALDKVNTVHIAFLKSDMAKAVYWELKRYEQFLNS